MRKMLVPTDFSTASRAGMRFAIQLATQINIEPVFYHAFQALVPTTVFREKYDDAVREQTVTYREKLEQFVADVHDGMHIQPGIHQCIVEENVNTDTAIIDYARHHSIALICMSTRGAGTLRQLLGTHTARVVAHSPVPVLVIPEKYRTQPVRRLLYASDLDHLGQELGTVMDFADELDARVDLAHFYHAAALPPDRETMTDVWRHQYPALDRLFFEPFDPAIDFDAQLDHMVHKTRADLTVLFTHPNHTWFDRLFGSSHAGQYTFVTKSPVLVYRKVGVESGLVVI